MPTPIRPTERLCTFALGVLLLALPLSADATNIDPQLLGYWRNTIHNPGIRYVKDTHLHLYQDGSLRLSAKGLANGRSFTEGPQGGVWSADGSVLRYQLDDGDSAEMPYETNGQTLIFPQETDYRLWDKIR